MSRTARTLTTIAVSVLAAALGGCGGGSRSAASNGGRQFPRALQGPSVPAAAVGVIKGWADALRAGQLQRAAAYWALPSAMVNGTDAAGRLAVLPIDSLHDALAADASLPCGATLTRTRRNGAYVEADFTLGARAGSAAASGCSGPARVDFLIRGHHIVRWLRAPTGQSAPGVPGPGTGAPAAPSVSV